MSRKAHDAISRLAFRLCVHSNKKCVECNAQHEQQAHAALDEALREARRQGGETVLAEAIKRVCPMYALGVKAYRASGGELVHNIGGAQPCRSAYLHGIPFIPFEEAKDANQG